MVGESGARVPEANSPYRMSILWDATKFYLAHMSEPAHASLGEDDTCARHACLGQEACICDLVLPGDATESSVRLRKSKAFTIALGESTGFRSHT